MKKKFIIFITILSFGSIAQIVFAQAVNVTTTTSVVNSASTSSVPGFPNVGTDPNILTEQASSSSPTITYPDPNIIAWETLAGILVVLGILFFLKRNKKQ